jgi:hypothetical protein
MHVHLLFAGHAFLALTMHMTECDTCFTVTTATATTINQRICTRVIHHNHCFHPHLYPQLHLYLYPFTYTRTLTTITITLAHQIRARASELVHAALTPRSAAAAATAAADVGGRSFDQPSAAPPPAAAAVAAPLSPVYAKAGRMFMVVQVGKTKK